MSADEVEIERKFLVDVEAVKKLLWPDIASGKHTEIDQGYRPVSLRVRLSYPSGGPHKAEITLKGPGAVTRYEKNIDIPPEHAHTLLRSCPASILKHRFRQGRWEIDRFANVNDPDTHELLWLAEIELKSEDEPFERPRWLGKEVSLDLRYTNAKLSENVVK
jgi:CYTH domain-containing protein